MDNAMMITTMLIVGMMEEIVVQKLHFHLDIMIIALIVLVSSQVMSIMILQI